MIDLIIFWVFASIAIIAAVGVVTNKSIIKAALMLLAVFLSQAAFFVLNNADFLAIAQILVYAVGLTIVLLFAIMFTGDKTQLEAKPVSRGAKIMTTLIVLYTAFLLLSALAYPFRSVVLPPDSFQVISLLNEGSTRMLGQLLFSRYGLPFELASILLTAAMIGAIVLSKKSFTDEENDSVKYRLDLSSHPTEEAEGAYRTSLTVPRPLDRELEGSAK
ncbi:MAG: NADH-quinone oxidoreductase subunit J [Vampirovibrionales bacterium]|nr:NADH-quinone oxidoreductase subunit J [Vampirovibrionales bacterium]